MAFARQSEYRRHRYVPCPSAWALARTANQLLLRQIKVPILLGGQLSPATVFAASDDTGPDLRLYDEIADLYNCERQRVAHAISPCPLRTLLLTAENFPKPTDRLLLNAQRFLHSMHKRFSIQFTHHLCIQCTTARPLNATPLLYSIHNGVCIEWTTVGFTRHYQSSR